MSHTVLTMGLSPTALFSQFPLGTQYSRGWMVQNIEHIYSGVVTAFHCTVGSGAAFGADGSMWEADHDGGRTQSLPLSWVNEVMLSLLFLLLLGDCFLIFRYLCLCDFARSIY